MSGVGHGSSARGHVARLWNLGSAGMARRGAGRRPTAEPPRAVTSRLSRSVRKDWLGVPRRRLWRRRVGLAARPAGPEVQLGLLACH
jgi:hypothetical protein